MNTRTIPRLAFYLGAVLLGLGFAYPVAWVIYSSFKTLGEIFVGPWPSLSPTLQNFVVAWRDMPYPRTLANSTIVMIGATVPCTLFSALAAYAFARMRFFGRYFFFMLLIGGILVPMQVTIIPVFLELKSMGLLNTYGGLIFPLIARWLPTGIFILTGFYRDLPKAIEESAILDGASRLSVFWRIVIPLSRPALSSVAILVSLQTWAEFLLPVVVAQDKNLYTLPLGVLSFIIGPYFTNWNYVFASLSLSIFPTIAVYLALHRSFISGLTSGAMKG